MKAKISPPIALMDGVTSATSGNAQLVEDFDDVVLSFDTEDSANLTIKVQGSMQEDQPDWDAAQAQDNQWEYLDAVDLEDRSSINGDTGISLAGTDDNRMLEVNTNLVRWVNVIITSYTAGTVYVRLSAHSN